METLHSPGFCLQTTILESLFKSGKYLDTRINGEGVIFKMAASKRLNKVKLIYQTVPEHKGKKC